MHRKITDPGARERAEARAKVIVSEAYHQPTVGYLASKFEVWLRVQLTTKPKHAICFSSWPALDGIGDVARCGYHYCAGGIAARNFYVDEVAEL